MSHYAELEVEFDVANEKELIESLEQQFGKGTVEVHPDGAALIGWHGDDRSKLSTKSPDYAPPCELIIRRKNVGSASNDIGFKRGSNGKFSAYISEYDSSSTFTKPRQGLVAQEYALRVAENQLKAEGWKTFRQKLDDGSVKLTAKDQVVKLKNW